MNLKDITYYKSKNSKYQNFILKFNAQKLSITCISVSGLS